MNDLKAKVLDKTIPPFERLCLLMEVLRSPEGCAWDRAQTHHSLLPYLIEEAYEVVEAVESGDHEELKDELGDVICQVVFHAQLAREKGLFEANDSVNCIIDKLVRRHPHVFGEQKELNPQQVRDQWEKIKTGSGEKKTVLGGLPRSMPALTMAFRIGEKAGGVGFDWDCASDVFEKIDEELGEIKQELDSTGPDRQERIAEEFGDLLFAVASAARKLKVDPEAALRKALLKFIGRFEKLEQEVNESGRVFDDYTLDQLEDIWQRVKKTD